MKKLPDKPSELIRLALKDLEIAETNPRIKIDMNQWHIPKENGFCYMCLAGSVMYNSLGSSIKKLVLPRDFGHYNNSRLQALNEFREGNLKSGLEYLELEEQAYEKGVFGNFNVTSYEYDPNQFKKDMLRMADDLESEGL